MCRPILIALASVPLSWSCSRAATQSNSDAGTVNGRMQNNPSAVFDRYLEAVHSRDMDGVLALVSDDVARVNYPGCTDEMDNKACLGTYVKQAVVDAAGKITVRSLEVSGDTVFAKLELRSDLTRRAGVDRALGTDRVRVLENRIIEFAFIPDFADEQTVAFFGSLGIHPPER